MLNHIWLWMIAISVILAAGNDFFNEVFEESPVNEQALLLSKDEINEPQKFLNRIGNAEDDVALHIKQLLKPSTRNMLDEYVQLEQVASSVEPSDKVLSVLIKDLNRIIKKKNIYDDQAFAALSIPAETKRLAEKMPKQDLDLMKVNRSLIELAFKQNLVLQRNLNEDTKLGQVTTAAIDAAGLAVEIAIGLIGIMALWLGIMKVAEEAGIINILAKIVRPITRRLFPTIPHDHPSIGAMIMNIAANMLGLSNAATPLGLKAMDELEKLNKKKGEATDDMITFLVINTSAITLVPATAIAIRASMGSVNPQKIVIPSILAASMATIVGLTVVKTIQTIQKRRNKGNPSVFTEEGGERGKS